MACQDLPPYLLQELADITDSIKYPIQNVQRIKYTCFDVSRSLIAFGATSGGIYVFNRSPCEFVQLIPNKDGAITRLSISHDEKYISFANGRGLVTVTACNQSLNTSHAVSISKEHVGNEVTAMIWSNHLLFVGDDVGKVSVLQLQNFITKTMFPSASLTIMTLDSRICQLDIKSTMLLVSSLTRCYVCDTSREQYRQIGQKLRDGDYGACFVDTEKNNEQNNANTDTDFTEVKQFNIVNDDSGFAVAKGLENTLIFCARPSSRIWEAVIDGTVIRTHQYKQVLGRNPSKIISFDSYQNERLDLDKNLDATDGQSVNFTKILAVNGAIFSFKKNALFFLNISNVDHTIWFEYPKDIVDCKVFNNLLYLWLSDGSIVNLKYTKIEKFLIQCYVEQKYVLCGEVCALFNNYLLSSNHSPKLHIIASLKDKIDVEILESIKEVLSKFENLKDDTQTSGIHVVDNTYNAKVLLEGESKHDDYKFSTLHPEAMQTLKGIGTSVTDKLHTSKKLLKEKWEGLEGKMKHLSVDKHEIRDITNIKKQDSKTETKSDENIEETNGKSNANSILNEQDQNIVYKESSQNAIQQKVDGNTEKDDLSKSLYQYYKLSVVNKETEESNLISIINQQNCDINEIYNLMLKLENYCVLVNAIDESKFVPNYIFLTYLNQSLKKSELLDTVIDNEVLYKYFVDSCISVNIKGQKISKLACECGFPLPYTKMLQTPLFSELIDVFIEKQWSTQSRNQCFDICKKMPYLWRKILYLRRNEDLLNILRLLLQMMDENLLHSFLPQFSLDVWDKTVVLYATLYANNCLNCSKKFENISVEDLLSWDNLGRLIIKSVGAKNAVKLMEKHADLINNGVLSVKFYHSCILVSLFEKYDASITNQLVDTLYSAYDYADSYLEICKLLRECINGQLKNTALPITVAAKSNHWGLQPITDQENSNNESTLTIDTILENIYTINNCIIDCLLCGLPLQNDVLIKDGGLWVFKCGHTFHGACLELNKLKLCSACLPCK